MSNSWYKFESLFAAACFFESSLALLALILAWLAGINPMISLELTWQALTYGVLGTLPLLAMFFSLHQVSAPAIQQIRHLLLATLGPMLSPYSWPHLLLLGAIAGFSEELLFRGVLEPWLASNLGYTAGLLLSNLLFGLVHAVTPLYALLAGLVGLYFSVSMTFGGGYNLLTPILIHGLYDFLAFIALVRMYRTWEKPL